jgi:hypothetical protein
MGAMQSSDDYCKLAASRTQRGVAVCLSVIYLSADDIVKMAK